MSNTTFKDPREAWEIAIELRDLRSSLTSEPKDIDDYVAKVDGLVEEVMSIRPDFTSTSDALNYLDRLIEKSAS